MGRVTVGRSRRRISSRAWRHTWLSRRKRPSARSSTTGQIVASLSSDGVTWTTVLTKTLTGTLAITSPATVGLFECSHNASALGTATFNNVNYTSP